MNFQLPLSVNFDAYAIPRVSKQRKTGSVGPMRCRYNMKPTKTTPTRRAVKPEMKSEMLYVQDDDGNFIEQDERLVLGADNGVADLLESVSAMWTSRPFARCVYVVLVEPLGVSVALINMADRRRMAKAWASGLIQDVLGARWLMAKRRDHARILLQQGNSTLLVNASRDLRRLRRHHVYGYQLEPGTSSASMGLGPDGEPLS